MNTKCFTIIFLLALLSPAALAVELTVTRLSVTGTETTDPGLVRAAFLEVAVGDTLDELALNQAADLARNRLIALGYFGSVEVLVLPSKTKPGTAALVVEVTEGFTGRYGGGALWARFGTANLGGQGHDVDLWLGWNRQALGWTARLAGAPGWTLGAEGGNRPLVWTDTTGKNREDHALGASTSLAKDWGWGWTTGAALGAEAVFDPGYGAPEFRSTPRAWIEGSGRAPEFSAVGSLVRFDASTFLPDTLVRGGLEARSTVALGGGFKAAFRGVVIAQTAGASTRDDLVLAGLDAVRKPYDATDRGRALGWTSAELRWANSWNLLGFTTLVIEPALVFDVGMAWNNEPSPLRWAAGAALRAFVGSPVSLPLKLDATFDQDQRFWLGFSTSAPY